MPAMSVGIIRMAPQAESFCIWSFCCTPSIARFTSRRLESRSRSPSICSVVRSTLSRTWRRCLRASGSRSPASLSMSRSSDPASGFVAWWKRITSPESVHPARDPGVASQHLRLYTVQIVLEPFAHRIVAFDDPVHDLVKDHMRSSLEPIGLAFHLLAEYAQGRICAVQDRDDEVRCHKGVYLPELDPLHALNVTRRPEHYKEALAVTLDLWSLIWLDRLLHCQLVQPELPSDGDELLHARLAEVDPGELAGFAAGPTSLPWRAGRGPATIHIDGTFDEHRRIIRRAASAPRRVLLCPRRSIAWWFW